MAVAARQVPRALKLFPPKNPGERRARNDETPKGKQIAFRPPPDIAEFLKGMEEIGYSKTAAVLRMLYLAKDVSDALGDQWWEVESRALREKCSPGAALAAYAAVGLKAEKKK